jgi:hypothetical protein
MFNKRILIIQCFEDAVIDREVEIIITICKHYNIESHNSKPKNIEDLVKDINSDKKGLYDYIYLASHGTCDWFGNRQGDECKIEWMDFGLALCHLKCVKEHAILFHSCCRGGSANVVNTMFLCCDQIEFVCGPTYVVTSEELMTSFVVFLLNREFRKFDPVLAAKKVSPAIEMRFECYDSHDVKNSAGFIDFRNKKNEYFDKKNKAMKVGIEKIGNPDNLDIEHNIYNQA